MGLQTIDNVESFFDSKVELDDWRVNAAVLGLYRMLQFLEQRKGYTNLYRKDRESLNSCSFEYYSKVLTEENFLDFAEHYFMEYMHHVKILNILNSAECISEKAVKDVNACLAINSIMKKVFVNLKYDGSAETRALILELIEKHRYEIIKDTFKNGKRMYAKFANSNKLFNEEEKICRLLNYSVDMDRKVNSQSYAFDSKTNVSYDSRLLDFIPFAFTKSRRSIFVNSSYSISSLERANNIEQIFDNEDFADLMKYDISLMGIFKAGSKFLNYDVEVIMKDIESDYYETMFIRRKALKILSSNYINRYSMRSIRRTFPITKDFDIHIEDIVTDAILNSYRLDSTIDLLLKSKQRDSYYWTIDALAVVNQLIVNSLQRGEDRMSKEYSLNNKDYFREMQNNAKQCAYICKSKLEQKNKIDSMRNKLIGALCTSDYSTFNQLLLKLSSLTGTTFSFAYLLFDDFERNKGMAYMFVNALGEMPQKDDSKKPVENLPVADNASALN